MKTEIAIAAICLTWIKLTLMTLSLVVKTLAKVLSNQKPSTLMFGVARDGAISLQTLVCDIKTESGTR